MKYNNVVLGTFLARPNRFVARVLINGVEVPCHVKNTSRLRELLLPGVTVSLQRADKAERKTPYSLIAVKHAGHWVNIDSQAPNKVFAEWAAASGYFGEGAVIRPETVYGTSRFDFYVEAGERRIFVEVKGVTLVEDDIARFPGAPTTRGVKHLNELGDCIDEGYEAMIVFIVKREDVMACGPNDDLDPDFGQAMREAVGKGVLALALDCNVTQDSLTVRNPLEIHL